MTMSFASATASANDSTSMSPNESVPSTVEDNLVYGSANERLLACLQNQASIVSLPDKKKTHRASIFTKNDQTKKRAAHKHMSTARAPLVPMEEGPATSKVSTKQKATRTSFSSRVQHPIKEKRPVQVANKPMADSSMIKKGIVVLQSSAQTADLSTEGPVIENKKFYIPERSIQNILPTFTKNRAAEEEAIATAQNETQLLGGRNEYTDEEKERLFKAVNKINPTKSADWVIVQKLFHAMAPHRDFHRRTATSLRSKYIAEHSFLLSASCSAPIPNEIYTDQENNLLMWTVGTVRPANDADWEIVKQCFEKDAPRSAPNRSIASLRAQLVRITIEKVTGEVQRSKMNSVQTAEPIPEKTQPLNAISFIVAEKRPVQDADLITGEDAKTTENGLIEDLSVREATIAVAESDHTKVNPAPSIEKSPTQVAARSTDEASNSKKRDIQKAGEDIVAPKKQRTRGTAAEYTKEETDRLVAAVVDVKPQSHGGPTWEQVKKHFDENAPLHLLPDAPNRTAISLHKRFSHIAAAMIIDALSGKPVSINDTSNLFVLENESIGFAESEPVVENESTGPIESEPIDNESIFTIRGTLVYNDQAGDEPDCRESAHNDPHRVYGEGQSTVSANANSGKASRDGTHSKLLEATESLGENDAIYQEADRLSDAMIAFFDRFNPDDGMIAAGNECHDAILSRLETIEGNMKTVNSKLGMILSCVQSEEELERANQWIL